MSVSSGNLHSSAYLADQSGNVLRETATKQLTLNRTFIIKSIVTVEVQPRILSTCLLRVIVNVCYNALRCYHNAW